MTTPIAEQGTDLHNQRLAQIDALIPAAPAPVPADGDIVIEVPGAIGLARTRRIDPNTLDACWGALTRQLLASPRVFGDDPGAAMSALLDSWGAWVRSQPPEPDTSAVVSWPSRDTSVIAAFLDHGLAPRVVLAARPGGRPTPPPTSRLGGLIIRPLEERDLGAAATRFLDVIRWDSQFQGSYLRESTPTAVDLDLQHALNSDGTSSWVADVDGQVVGLGTLEWPKDASWISPQVAGDPDEVAYLGVMSVQPGRRGGGIGSALAAHLHRAVDEAGIRTTVLHHSPMNPLSTPFWHRCGYRPLWTTWEARPHSALR